MLLLLMRHGIAEEGVPDAERALTGKGRDRVKDVARWIGRHGVLPDIVLSSCRVRAVQTAEAILEALELDRHIEQCREIDFFPAWEEFAALVNRCIEGQPEEVTVLVSGHQPGIGQLIVQCLTGDVGDMNVRKAACAAIHFDGPVELGAGDLYFYTTPGVTRAARG